MEVWGTSTEFDFEQGKVRGEEQELFATLYFENDKCTSILTDEDMITLSYDETGRIIYIGDTYGNQCGVTYSEQGGYSISDNDAEVVLKYNSDGVNVEYCDAEGDENYSVTTYYDKVAEIYYGETPLYRFRYNENGQVCHLENVYEGITAVCTYNSYMGKEKLHQVEYTTVAGETLTRVFQYDDEGRISEIHQDYDSISLSYDRNGRCSGYTYYTDAGYQSVHIIVYDDLGRVIDIEM